MTQSQNVLNNAILPLLGLIFAAATFWARSAFSGPDVVIEKKEGYPAIALYIVNLGAGLFLLTASDITQLIYNVWIGFSVILLLYFLVRGIQLT